MFHSLICEILTIYTNSENVTRMGSIRPVIVANANPNVDIINIQNIGSDQVFTLRPSNGP